MANIGSAKARKHKLRLKSFIDEDLLDMQQKTNGETAEGLFIDELAIAIAAIAREIYATEVAQSKESARKS